MSVFLAPDLRPFYASTYFPPVQRYNMPAFRDLLAGIARAWKEEPDEIARVSNRVGSHLQQAISSNQANSTAFTQSDLNTAANSLFDSYDWDYGGWGMAPKFPQPMTIEFLIEFPSGSTSVTVTSQLSATDSDQYVLRVRAGQTLNVNLTFTEGQAILIVWGADETVLLSDHAEASSFQRVLPSTQDYYITVKGNPNGSARYSMTVAIPPTSP